MRSIRTLLITAASIILLSGCGCIGNQGAQPTPTPTPTATQQVSIDYSTILPQGALSIEACCNVDLVVTDPEGMKLGSDSDIDGVIYSKTGRYSGYYHGELGDYYDPTEVHIWIGKSKTGNYEIEVIPEEWACTEGTFTLTVAPLDNSCGYVPMAIVEDFPISEISGPFIYQCKPRIPTTIAYTGVVSCEQYSTAELSAVLLDQAGSPVSGKTIDFQIGYYTHPITAVTDSDGRAVAELTVTQEPSDFYNVWGGFNGDMDYAPSQWVAPGFAVLPSSSGQSPIQEYDCDTFTWAKDGLTSDLVYSIAIDDYGNKWFGTEAGVSMFNGKSWVTYEKADGLAGNVITSIAIDSSGNKWFATGSGSGMFGFGGSGSGISKFDGSTWTTYTSDDGLADDYVTDIATDTDGNVWFATVNGTSKFDGIDWTTYTSEDGLPCDEVRCIEVDLEGNLWFGTDRGICKFGGSIWTTYTHEDCLAGDVITAMAFDSDGNIWAATNLGVSHFDGAKWITYPPEEISIPVVLEGDLIVPSVIDIKIEDDGTIWIVTLSACAGGAWGGLSKFDGNEWKYYISMAGAEWLACEYIWDMEIDSEGYKWLGTDSGVIRFK